MPGSGQTPPAVLDKPGGPQPILRTQHRSWPGVQRVDVVGALVSAVGSLLVAAFALRLWNAHLHIPFGYSWDGILTGALVKNVINGGWIFSNHSVGAPLGAQFLYYPLGTDNLHWLILKMMGIVSDDPARVLNVFYLLTFPADALAGYAVLRWLRISAPASVVCAILFATAPYHLLQGEVHVFLGDYVAVPLGAYLILSILDGSSWSPIRGGSGIRDWRGWLPSRTGLRILLCVLIGSIGVYYSAFTMVLVALTGLATAGARRTWRPLVPAALVFVTIGAMILFDTAPTLVYQAQHGADTQVAHRLPLESELYSLNLAGLVLPVPGDRIGPLDHLRHTYDSTTPVPSGGDEALGIVAGLGFLWLCCVALAGVVGFGRLGPALERHRQLGFAALIAFLCGTFGGISALIAYLITPEIRAWDWISIFISFFALAAAGLGLDALARWLGGARRWLWGVALVLVCLVGAYDQSTREAIPPYAANAASYGSDAQFVGQIEKLLPKGAAVFQLPYVPFPENPPVVRMVDYDELRGYVHSTDLSWSYGAIKGSPEDWGAQSQNLPLNTLIQGVAASGFSGAWIDRFGYSDNGVSVAAGVQTIAGTRPVSSRDGRLLFFDLRPLAARLRARYSASELLGLRHAILRPTPVAYTGGFDANEGGSRWSSSTGSAVISNTTRSPERMVFSASVFTLAKGRWPLRITAPDGQVRDVTIGTTPKPIVMTFNTPPGDHAVTFTSTAPVVPVPGDTRSLAVRYERLVLEPAALAPLAG